MSTRRRNNRFLLSLCEKSIRVVEYGIYTLTFPVVVKSIGYIAAICAICKIAERISQLTFARHEVLPVIGFEDSTAKAIVLFVWAVAIVIAISLAQRGETGRVSLLAIFLPLTLTYLATQVPITSGWQWVAFPAIALLGAYFSGSRLYLRQWAEWAILFGRGCWIEEFPDDPNRSRRRTSPILHIAALIMWILRRASLFNHINHVTSIPLSKDELERTPAWFTDCYILLWCPLLISMLHLPPTDGSSAIAGFLICQILNINFYTLVWRGSLPQERANSVREYDAHGTMPLPVLSQDGTLRWEKPSPPRSGQPAFSHTRNAVLAFVGWNYINWLFALIYFWSFSTAFKDTSGSLPFVDLVYFSYVVSATLGFGDISPAPASLALKSVVTLHICVAVAMLSFVFTSALNAATKDGRSEGRGA